MTNKQRFIKAIKILIKDRYTDGKDINCPICSIFKDRCTRCPLGICYDSYFGCLDMETFKVWRNERYSEPRFEFWQKALLKFEKLPDEYFTKKVLIREKIGQKTNYKFPFIKEIEDEVCEKYKLN
jgi:hypothetical protein